MAAAADEDALLAVHSDRLAFFVGLAVARMITLLPLLLLTVSECSVTGDAYSRRVYSVVAQVYEISPRPPSAAVAPSTASIDRVVHSAVMP